MTYSINVKVSNIDKSCANILLKFDKLAALGFTLDNKDLLRAHIEELKEIGSTSIEPTVYWLDPTRLSSSNELFVVGNETSGEVEYFVGYDETGEIYITVGSDHTDRKLEKISIPKSKQICNKIISNIFWRFSDIVDHFEDLELVSYILKSGKMVLYQKGKVSDILDLRKLENIVKNDQFYKKGEKVCFFIGTIPILNGKIEYSEKWHLIFYDPILRRKIEHSYRVIIIPEENF